MKLNMKYQVNKRKIMKKNRDYLLQKQNHRYTLLKELVISFIELENRMKALEKVLINK